MTRVIVDANWLTFAALGQCLWSAVLAHTMRMGFHSPGSPMNE
jgi:hypothetical protein